MTAEHVAALALAGEFGLASEGVAEGLSGGWALLGTLAVLALIDSTSFGTLLIPVWLMMAPGRLRAGRVLLYLAVVTLAYALIGLALLTAMVLFGEDLLAWLDPVQQSPAFLMAQAGLAAALIWYSGRLDPWTRAGKEKKRDREASRPAGDRVSRFRQRAVGEGAQGGVEPLLGLALTAVGLEIVTLIPYLMGIGLVAAQSPGPPASAGMILFYCAVMIAPALLLLIGRILARRALQRPLQRLEGFLSRHANGTIALILFLVGLFLGLNALEGLRDAGIL